MDTETIYAEKCGTTTLPLAGSTQMAS